MNAIYFKGQWDTPFDEKLTKKQEFVIDEKQSVMVDTMEMEGQIRTKHNREFRVTVIKLPFNNATVNMLIVLPNDYYQLEELERKLSRATTKRVLRLLKMDNRPLIRKKLFLPKFKMETSLKLLPMLENPGFDKIFKVLPIMYLNLIQSKFTLTPSIIPFLC